MIYVLFVDDKMTRASVGSRVVQIIAQNEKQNGHKVRIEMVYPSGRIEDITKEMVG